MNTINPADGIMPKIRKSRKYPFDKLQVGESFDVGEYTKDLMQSKSSIIIHYNKTRYPKRFYQTTIDNIIRIYRDKDCK